VVSFEKNVLCVEFWMKFILLDDLVNRVEIVEESLLWKSIVVVDVDMADSDGCLYEVCVDPHACVFSIRVIIAFDVKENEIFSCGGNTVHIDSFCGGFLSIAHSIDILIRDLALRSLENVVIVVGKEGK